MDSPATAPPWLALVTAAEDPELWREVDEGRRFDAVWPEYNHHGNRAGEYFGVLASRHPALQVLALDRRSGEVVGRARTIPFRWDETLGDLPHGIDAVGLRAVTDAGIPTALSALAAEVLPTRRGEGLSGWLLESMRAVARSQRLAPLVAPVRPSRKDRFPSVPIGQYARWRRPDGRLFDPWLRTHERLGGRILRCEPRSMEIRAPVADWEHWTGMRFAGEGTYVFPAGLAPLEVRQGEGTYFEPNVWVRHEV